MNVFIDSLEKGINIFILLNHRFRNASDEPLSFQILSQDEMPKAGKLISIDAEFVALSQEETEIRSDGTKSVIRPSRRGLARVSVLRGENGDLEGVPFIDDYIANSEPIVDYLTEYSGIEGKRDMGSK
jgi:PAB-dependent poly(A)-specific ribonuclease subunit 2